VSSIEEQVLKAKYDSHSLEALLQKHQYFILHSVYRVTHRFASIHDDEYSIAQEAFVQAVESYDSTKGSFLPFAYLLIRRRVIDYLRSRRHHKREVSIDPILFTGERASESEEDLNKLWIPIPMTSEDHTLQWEILSLKDVLSSLDITFSDLVSCSPKAEKTKKACAKAVVYILKNPILLANLHDTKTLPLKILENDLQIPRKTLESHRKYIIAAIEIMHGDYPMLSEYLGIVREEMMQ
jgi:RNA polymerase sigma factor